MTVFRLSNHPLVRWWWSLDRWTVILVLAIMVFGAAVITTASSGVARGYNVDAYYFARRQFVFLLSALPLMVTFSMLNSKGMKQISLILFAIATLGVVATLFVGTDVKGASRWINVGGFSLQPSEFLKPAFVVLTAWLMSSDQGESRLRGFFISAALLGVLSILFLLQPNFGMFVVVSCVWFGQMFMVGLPWQILGGLMSLVLMVMGTGYMLLPHVRSRIHRFLDPNSGDTYQIDRAMEAFFSGGFTGRGPGEGIIKQVLPDAHTDFIFAVIGEEFGILVCSAILLTYGIILFRSFLRLLEKGDRFTMLAGLGLLLQLGLQILINVGVALRLLPTTGATLPFISYGGSSTLALAILVGFVLALTRKGTQTNALRKRPRQIP